MLQESINVSDDAQTSALNDASDDDAVDYSDVIDGKKLHDAKIDDASSFKYS